MSTTCPRCHKAIKIEDLLVKSYIPVVDLQTCGKIKITKRGRVAAQRIQCGDGIECEGAVEGSIESDGDVQFGPKAFWKGRTLQSRALKIAAGAKLMGVVTVPWSRLEPKPATPEAGAAKKTTAKKVAAAKKTTTSRSATTRTSVTKKTTARTKVAKKSATKKTVAKKTVTKKITAKKVTAAKKTATRKALAKKKKKTAKKTTTAGKTAAKKKTAKKKKTARKR
jgi:hypothetical protein